MRQRGVDALHTAGAIEGNLQIGGVADRGDEQRRDDGRAGDRRPSVRTTVPTDGAPADSRRPAGTGISC